MTLLGTVQMVAVLIVLAEALNKIERSDLFEGIDGRCRRARAALRVLVPWHWRRPRVVTALKVLGWACLSIGAAGSMLKPPSGAEVAVLGGFALLIVRSRIKEG